MGGLLELPEAIGDTVGAVMWSTSHVFLLEQRLQGMAVMQRVWGRFRLVHLFVG